MERLREIYSEDRQKRVVFYRRLDDSFSFVEEIWFESEFGQGWAIGKWPDSICDSLETAVREARGRLPWFDTLIAQEVFFTQNSELPN
jgi:hypothetical protein